MISRRLRGYLVRHRGQYLRGSALSIVATGLAVTNPWVLRQAVDGIRSGISLRSLAGLAGLYVAVAVGTAFFRFFWRTNIIGASREVECEIRNDYFAHLQRLHLGFFQHTRTGDLMARAVNDLNAVHRLAGVGLLHAFNTVVMFLVIGILMFSLDVRLALSVSIILPMVTVVFVLLGRRIHQRFEQVQEQFSTISTKAQENFSGIRVVKAFAQEPHEIEDFGRINREFIGRNLRLILVSGALWPSMTLILGIASAVVLWQGGIAVIQGRISLGTLVQFFAYLGQLSWPMIALGWVTNIIQQGMASMRRLDEVFNVRPAIADHPDPRRLNGVAGAVEFRDVSFEYDTGGGIGATYDSNGEAHPEHAGGSRPPVRVLDHVSLSIPAGSTVALVGPTGSGKSTLVHLIPRFFDPTEGQVLIDGLDARRIPVHELRRAIGFVPQEPFLFSDTLSENVRFGVEEHDGERVVESATVAQLASDVEMFPRGYETLVGERGVTLSGGQKQRATLARALARDPAILILDDALSSVDTQTEEQILRGLRGVMASRTSIIISHRVSTVRHADHIVVLDEGRIVERGSHDELVARDGVYGDLYRKQLLTEELEAET